MAQLIRIDTVSRSAARQSHEEDGVRAFAKALALVHRLKDCCTQERKSALENWLACERITRGEYDELYEFYGWERAP